MSDRSLPTHYHTIYCGLPYFVCPFSSCPPRMTATASLALNSASFISIMDAPHTHTLTPRFFLIMRWQKDKKIYQLNFKSRILVMTKIETKIEIVGYDMDMSDVVYHLN